MFSWGLLRCAGRVASGIGFLIGLLTLGFSAHAQTKAAQIKARPRMVGEKVAEANLRTLDGKDIALIDLVRDKYTVLILGDPEFLRVPEIRRYLEVIEPHLMKLGYQTLIVLPLDVAAAKPLQKGSVRIYSDESRAVFKAMGLADSEKKTAPYFTGVFLVGPGGDIRLQFVSTGEIVALSGDVLVLAARSFRDMDQAAPRSAAKAAKEE